MRSVSWPIFVILSLVWISGYGSDPGPAWHVSKAVKLFAEKSYDSALFHFTTGAKLHSNDEAILRAITGAGQCMIRLRKFDDGIALLTAYERVTGKIDSVSEVLEDYYDVVSQLHYYAGDAFTSLKYHQFVYSINSARGQSPVEKQIELVRVMGVLLGNCGQLKRAVDYYSMYADLVAQHLGPTHIQMGDAYNYLGVMYRHLGEYEMALDYYARSLEISERYTAEERSAVSSRFRSVASTYNNIGTVYHSRGDHANALAYTLKALNLFETERSTNKISLASILSSLGTTYSNLQRYDEALRHKEKALSIYLTEYGERHGRVATELKNIGDTHFAMKSYSTAEEYYRRSLNLNLEVHGTFHANTAEAYAKMASIEERKGNIEGALSHIQKGIQCLVSGFTSDLIFDNPEIGALSGARTHLIDKLTIKGNLLLKLFDQLKDTKLLSVAHETYSLAVDFSEIVRYDLVDGRSKAYLAENSKVLLEKTIHTAMLLHKATQQPEYISFAFSTMEKNKSRLLLESLQASQAKDKNKVKAELLNEESGLQGQIAFIEQKIFDETVSVERDSTTIAQWKERLFETRRKLEAFKRTLEKDYPRYFLTKYERSELSLSTLQQRLGSKEMIVEYFAGENALYIVYITRTKSGIISEDLSVLDAANELLKGVRARDTKGFLAHAYPLYSRLLAPVIGEAGSKEKIIIIPDGILSYLPFELLLTKPSENEKSKDFDYAIRKHNFSYRFSAALMASQLSGTTIKTPMSFAGFAPQFGGEIVASRGLPGNIPYAQREVKEISATFPGAIYVGDEASEYNFRQHAGNAELLHLATHASLDENANLSRLYFAGVDSTDDGLLHAYEIYNLHLNAKLITLSACNTGAGTYKEGEGVMSLSRAFAYAGCESMLTSLWPSQDQTTADLMAAFYKNLANGASKDEALRQAKLDFLSKADDIKSDPFYWAGFVLIGNTDPVNEKSLVNVALISTSGVAFLILSIFAILRSRLRKIPLKPLH